MPSRSASFSQQSAQAASVSAMYEYGNNTAELADKWYQLSKQSASIKQFKAAKNWEQAASELATSSAKQASDYAYAASKLNKGLAGAGKAAKDTGEKYKKYNQRVPIMPNMDAFNAYRGD